MLRNKLRYLSSLRSQIFGSSGGELDVRTERASIQLALARVISLLEVHSPVCRYSSSGGAEWRKVANGGIAK